MGKKYKNPPIVEAICEFQLTQDTNWDLTVPGLFYERIKSDFPLREQRMLRGFEFIPGPEKFQQRIMAMELVLFLSRDKKKLVQLGPRLMAVNVLRPYPGWQAFKPRIEKAWETLQQVVEIKGLARINLRYINRIEFSTQDFKLQDYFAFYPFTSDLLPRQMTSFFAGVEFPFEGDRDRCKVQLFPSAGEREGVAIILDIEYFLSQPGSVKITETLYWIEEAHSRVEEVFEGCITDKLRAMFEEVS